MATQVEEAIAKGKSLLGSHAYDEYCQRFVRVCYEAANIYGNAASAAEACGKWRISTSKNNIPVGAAVYYSNNNQYGHVAIYLGNDQILHAWNGVQITSISKPSGYLGWGWQGGVKPTGAGTGIDLFTDGENSGAASGSDSEKVELCSTSVISTVNVGGEVSNKGLHYDIIGNKDNPYELHIVNNGVDYQPIITDEVVWTTEWRDTAGKLEFSILKDDNLNIQEGNAVMFLKNGTGIFYGYLFTKSRNKNGIINCVAYDQLRYLKNKDTYCYKDKTLKDVILMIAADYRLSIDRNKLADTGYTIPGRVEDDQTLFDIIKNALDLTENATGKIYIFFDDYGHLSLQPIDALRTDYLLDDETAEDIDYKSTIDEDVYNQIQFFRDDETTGNREKYIYQNAELINEWGVLQLTCKLENGDNPETFGRTILDLYAQKKRELTVNDCLGDTRLRAGASVFVNLNLGDIIFQNVQPIITKAVHRFGKKYSCDLTLLGGEPYIG